MDTLLNFTPPLIAHRGASALAPENTMAAFIQAAQLGVTWVEFDVMLAKSGEAIIIHDETLSRTTDADGFVGDYTYAELSTFDAGSWFSPTFSGERIPLLKEALCFIKQKQMRANIEIKPLPNEEERTVQETLAVVRSIYDITTAPLLFSSFSMKTLRLLRRFSPDCLLGLLLDHWDPEWEQISHELNCVSIHLDQSMVTKEVVRKIKAMGKRVLCYTVNNQDRAKELFEIGVDAIFTDVPDLMLGRSS